MTQMELERRHLKVWNTLKEHQTAQEETHLQIESPYRKVLLFGDISIETEHIRYIARTPVIEFDCHFWSYLCSFSRYQREIQIKNAIYTWADAVYSVLTTLSVSYHLSMSYWMSLERTKRYALLLKLSLSITTIGIANEFSSLTANISRLL